MSAEECLEKINWLYSNRKEKYNMQKANEEYYKKFLRPDKQVSYAMKIAMGSD